MLDFWLIARASACPGFYAKRCLERSQRRLREETNQRSQKRDMSFLRSEALRVMRCCCFGFSGVMGGIMPLCSMRVLCLGRVQRVQALPRHRTLLGNG
eukprot:s3576_g4.t1